MRKIVLRDRRPIPPFNDPARDLRVLNKPLWLHQRDVLARHVKFEREVDSFEEIESKQEETLVYRENLFFDEHFLEDFLDKARRLGKPCQLVFPPDDKAIVNHALPLQETIRRKGDYYVTDMWYFPRGVEETVLPLVMRTEPREVGYYHVPTHMSDTMGDLIYHVPTKAFLAIETWVHVLLANVVFGVFARGARLEKAVERSVGLQLRLLGRALLEQKQVLSSSKVVKVGRNCSIDPSAIIRGPTTIGDNVTIGPGAVIDNCVIGSNVDIAQGCQLMLSVVSDRCFLPFRAALFMSVMMEDSMVAQNTCLQLSCIGRGSFVGAGNTFTDFNLIPKPLRALHWDRLEPTGMTVLGGCVGHHCRIGSGMIVYPARTIESDSVLVATPQRRVIQKDVTYEESDVHQISEAGHLHPRLYPRPGEQTEPETDHPEDAGKPTPEWAT
ncbi:MAG TPA: multidrug transporter [Anaerolineales bacterium]|nr:multidrug transporter [Anaerolineae bacterium]HIQ02045.1 multidrug transporter [Anaerolineales bacterium]